MIISLSINLQIIFNWLKHHFVYRIYKNKKENAFHDFLNPKDIQFTIIEGKKTSKNSH